MKNTILSNILENVVSAIKLDLDSKKNYSFSLMQGETGKLLFLSYYSAEYHKKDIKDLCDEIIDRCIALISESESLADSFCNGVTGFVWVLKHLRHKKLIEFEDDLLEDIDNYLLHKGKRYFDEELYDFLHSGIGIGLYFLQSGNTELIEYSINKLIEFSIEDDLGIRWRNKIAGLTLDIPNEISFGLSHGLASIIVYLTLAYQKGIKRRECQILIEKTIKFIKSQEFSDNEIYRFPRALYYEDGSSSMKVDMNGRLAWCHGDMGVAYSLMKAGIGLKEKSYFKEGVSTAKRSLHLRKASETKISDGGLCHGYFGAAHLYNKFYRLTKDTDFEQASKYWFHNGIKYVSEYNKIDNYKVYLLKEWKRENGFLYGIAGIGMVVLNHLQKNPDYSWEQAFLLE